jgi:hypothetical protein
MSKNSKHLAEKQSRINELFDGLTYHLNKLGNHRLLSAPLKKVFEESSDGSSCIAAQCFLLPDDYLLKLILKEDENLMSDIHSINYKYPYIEMQMVFSEQFSHVQLVGYIPCNLRREDMETLAKRLNHTMELFFVAEDEKFRFSDEQYPIDNTITHISLFLMYINVSTTIAEILPSIPGALSTTYKKLPA